MTWVISDFFVLLKSDDLFCFDCFIFYCNMVSFFFFHDVFSYFRGEQTQVFLEHAIEGSDALKAAFAGDIGQGIGGVLDQVAGSLAPILVDQVLEINAQRTVELTGKIFIIVAQLLGHAVKGNVRSEMFFNVGKRVHDPCLLSGRRADMHAPWFYVRKKRIFSLSLAIFAGLW